MNSLIKMEEDQILSIVEALMDNCLAGSNENNHAKHVKDFTDRMKRIVTPENLAQQLSQSPRSYFRDRKFIALFKRKNSVAVVWKQYISLSEDELVNQAIFVQRDNRILIDHCMIC